MIEHLAESTDTVKNQSRLVKKITIAAYWCLWLLIILYYWLIAQPNGGIGGRGGLDSRELLCYFIYPLCITAISGFIGANKSFNKLRWLYVPISGVMLMLTDLMTEYLKDSIYMYYDMGAAFNPFEVIYSYFAENIGSWVPMTFIIGCIGCAAGIFVGSFVRYFLLASEKAEKENNAEAK